METLIIGCGYLGQRVAGRYLRSGRGVSGVVRSRASAMNLESAGVTAIRADLDQPPLPLLPLAGAELFIFTPPPGDGVVDRRIGELLRTFSYQGDPARVVYLSTTGVYGDCAGEWVDEQRPVVPQAPRALRRWDAEQQLCGWSEAAGGELVILRVAGIYGPGKLPLERLRKGLPMVCEAEAPYSNRIHIDDLLQVCVAAMAKGRPGTVYNVSDGHPTTMTDYFNRLADLAGLPRPPLIPLAAGEGRLSAGMLSYMRESRRLDNRRMLDELEVVLRYPDLLSGLPAALR